MNLAENISSKSLLFQVVHLYRYIFMSLSLKVSVLLHILMGYISFIAELQELFIYSGYKSSDRYLNCKYSLSVNACLFISFFFLSFIVVHLKLTQCHMSNISQ